MKRFPVALTTLALIAATLAPALPAAADETPPPAPAPAPIVEQSTAPAAYAGPGAVTIDRTATPLHAITADWPADTTFAFRWFRGTTATTATTAATGAGAATPNYTPNTLDKFLRVRVTATVPGSTGTTVRYSEAANYSITVSGGAVVSPFPVSVGQTVSLDWQELTTFSSAGGGLSGALTLSGYQWLRNGVAITGATSPTYVVAAADLNKDMSARATISAPGAAPTVITSFDSLVHGVSFISPAITVAPPTARTLTASVSYTDPNPAPAASLTYRWYRDGVAISGATAASYTLTVADAHSHTTVKATLSKTGYDTIVLETGGFYTLESTGSPQIGPLENLHIGGLIAVTTPSYLLGGSPVSPTFTYQWLRDGVAIPSADALNYTPQSADNSHTLSVRVTATYGGYLPSVVTSAATQKVGAFAFSDVGVPIEILHTGTPATLSVGTTGVTSGAGQVILSQWYRNGTAISGATHATYTLTAADYGTTTGVRLTFTAPGYTTYVKRSADAQFSLTASGPPTVSSSAGALYRVGDTLSAILPTYQDDHSVTVAPNLTSQWLRNGVAIATATTASYRLQTADKGAKISLRVTASYAGLNTLVATTAPTPAIDFGLLVVAANAPVVTNTVGTLSVSLPAGTVSTPDVTYAYQWFRQTGAATPVAISGASHQTYVLTATDLDKKISARVTVSKANVIPTSVPLTSVGVDYSIKVNVAPVVNGVNKVGNDLVAIDGSYQSAAGNPVYPEVAIQWYRNGVALAGKTGTIYTLTSADLGRNVTARFTETLTGFVGRAVFAGSTSPVTALGQIATAPGGFIPIIQSGTTAGQLRAVLVGGISTPGVTYSYQWKRNGVNVKGATTTSFVLSSSDAPKLISYTVTVKKTAYASLSTTAVAHRYGIRVSSAGTGDLIPIFGAGKVGGYVYGGSGWSWVFTESGAPATPTVTTYQWFRQTGPAGTPVAISGATGNGYTPVAADSGKYLRLRYGVSGPGMAPYTVYSGPAGPIGLGTNTADGTAVATMNPATDTLTASLQGLAPAAPAPVLTYQWFRGATKISGATARTYKPTAADTGAVIHVEIKVARPGFVLADALYTVSSVGSNYSVHTDPAGTFGGGSPAVDVPISAPVSTYKTSAGTTISGGVLTYQWYRQSGSAAPVAIVGATGSTFSPTAAYLGLKLLVRVSAKFPGYLRFSALSNATPTVTTNYMSAGGQYPFITRRSPTSLVLKANIVPGSISPAPTKLTYQWNVGGINVPGATASTFALRSVDYNKPVAVSVGATRPGYSGISYSSPPLNTFSVYSSTPMLFTGTIEFGSPITAYPGSLTNSAGSSLTASSISYQWYRDTTPISGATKQTYYFTAADIGHRVSAVVRPAVTGYLSGPSQTDLVGPVAARQLNGEFLHLPSITYSSPVSGVRTFTAHYETNITTPGYVASYQWYVNGVPVGTNSRTYKKSGPWLNISVKVTLSKTGYQSKAVTSGPFSIA